MQSGMKAEEAAVCVGLEAEGTVQFHLRANVQVFPGRLHSHTPPHTHT